MKVVEKQKSDNRMVVEAKSVPAGIDWQLLRKAKERIRLKKAG